MGWEQIKIEEVLAENKRLKIENATFNRLLAKIKEDMETIHKLAKKWIPNDESYPY